MKRTITSIFIALGVTMAWAQSIKQQAATAEDYIPLFIDMGYEVYSFDISELGKDSVTYGIQPIVKHYVSGKEEEFHN